MNNQETSVSYLQSLFSYDPESGHLKWRRRPLNHFKDERAWKIWHTRYCNQIAGTASSGEYVSITVDGKCQRAHRIIWAVHYGRFPDGCIDHINGIMDDNRLVNLRDVSVVINSQNTKKHSDNKSGVIGVSYSSRDRLWYSDIGLNGKNKHLGGYKTFEEAVEVRRMAEIKYGYHENHGR